MKQENKQAMGVRTFAMRKGADVAQPYEQLLARLNRDALLDTLESAAAGIEDIPLWGLDADYAKAQDMSFSLSTLRKMHKADLVAYAGQSMARVFELLLNRLEPQDMLLLTSFMEMGALPCLAEEDCDAEDVEQLNNLSGHALAFPEKITDTDGKPKLLIHVPKEVMDMDPGNVIGEYIMRDLVSLYGRAAASLYGALPIRDLQKLIRHYEATDQRRVSAALIDQMLEDDREKAEMLKERKHFSRCLKEITQDELTCMLLDMQGLGDDERMGYEIASAGKHEMWLINPDAGFWMAANGMDTEEYLALLKKSRKGCDMWLPDTYEAFMTYAEMPEDEHSPEAPWLEKMRQWLIKEHSEELRAMMNPLMDMQSGSGKHSVAGVAEEITGLVLIRCRCAPTLDLVHEVIELLGRLGIRLKSKADADIYANLAMNLRNNTRMMINYSWTPTELRLQAGEEVPNLAPITPLHAKVKIGRNDSCPCGSGKKYKNCCGKNLN